MSNIFEQFKKIGIIPVVVLDDAKDAKALGGALCEGARMRPHDWIRSVGLRRRSSSCGVADVAFGEQDRIDSGDLQRDVQFRSIGDGIEGSGVRGRG